MKYWGRFYQDGDCISVEFPDVPGALTYGETLDEAKKMASEALNGVLASMVDDSLPLPPAGRHEGFEFHPVEVKPTVLAAAHIRGARKAAGLTQKEMAARLDVAYQVYQKLEDPEKSNPTVKTLARIAGALGHTLEIAI
jgi:antitoxin HicB